jgi:hypothetical protein
MTDFIAERVIHARDAKGANLQFRFAMEAPRQIDDMSWECALLMEGIVDRPRHRVIGQDAWQALTLALRLMEQLLTYFVEDGGSLFWEESDIPITVSDVIPRVLTSCSKSDGLS